LTLLDLDDRTHTSVVVRNTDVMKRREILPPPKRVGDYGGQAGA